MMIKRLHTTGLVLMTYLCLFGCAKHSDGPPKDRYHGNISPAIPHPEPKSKFGNPDTYKVFGKSYHVLPSAHNFVQEGYASWYGTKFHGHLTSSREPYDLWAMTGAHKTLPIPTYVRVTNLKNHRNAIVRINDRGPFHADRILDLSYAAASKLGITSQGTAPVRIETIEFNKKRDAIQIGVYSNLSNAERVKSDLQCYTKHVHMETKRYHNASRYAINIDPDSMTDQLRRHLKNAYHLDIASKSHERLAH